MYLQSRIPRGARQHMFSFINAFNDGYELHKAFFGFLLLLRREFRVQVLNSHRILVFMRRFHKR